MRPSVRTGSRCDAHEVSMPSPALDLLLRYQDDPSLDPGMEDVGPNVSQGLRDTILRGRKAGGKVVGGARGQAARDNRMNELDQFLSFRERFEQRQDMVNRGLLNTGSHQYLNFFNDLWTNPRYGRKKGRPGGTVIPPFMAGGIR